MLVKFKKNNFSRLLPVIDNKIIGFFKINNKIGSKPTVAELEADGWVQTPTTEETPISSILKKRKTKKAE